MPGAWASRTKDLRQPNQWRWRPSWRQWWSSARTWRSWRGSWIGRRPPPEACHGGKRSRWPSSGTPRSGGLDDQGILLRFHPNAVTSERSTTCGRLRDAPALALALYSTTADGGMILSAPSGWSSSNSRGATVWIRFQMMPNALESLRISSRSCSVFKLNCRRALKCWTSCTWNYLTVKICHVHVRIRTKC